VQQCHSIETRSLLPLGIGSSHNRRKQMSKISKIIKIIEIIFLLFFTINIFAERITQPWELPEGKTWEQVYQDKLYKDLFEAEVKEDVDSLRKATLAYAIATERDPRFHARLAWKFNNLAYELIKDFQMEAEYFERIETYESMTDTAKKNEYDAETKKIFGSKIYYCIEAKTYLLKAKELDDSLPENEKNPDRTSKINNNLKFVNWMIKYTSN